MSGVGLVLPVHAAGGDDTDGGLLALHDPDLHGGGLGAQEQRGVLSQVEGVRPLPGGVAFVGIQPGEVVLCQLHLGALGHGEAHAKENVLHLVNDGGDGVLVTQGRFRPGNGHVQGFRGQLFLQGLFRQGGVLGGDGLGQSFPDLVGDLADHRAFLRGQFPHLLQNGGQLALLAQIFDPDAIQGGGVLTAGDGGQGL